MVRKANWIAAWCACAVLAGCGSAKMESSYPSSGNAGGDADYAAAAAPAPEEAQAQAFAGQAELRGAQFSDDAVASARVQVTGASNASGPVPPPPASPQGKIDKKATPPRGEPLAQNSAQAPTAPNQTPQKQKTEQRADVEAVAQPMLVYTATMSMAVFEVKKSLSEVEGLARELGGFLAKRTDREITIRVPVARFDDAIGRLEKMGDVLARNVTAEDVTEEFFDLEVRMKSARAVRDRLELLLQKATKVEDSVLIERELTRVVGEIERIEGRMKFLRDRASYSTITVDFRARGSERVGSGPFNLPVPWLHELGLRRLLNL